ncbi:MAG TPA: HD-GYP domain-containing protein [Thermoanaerobaculia bacterium]
MVADPVKMPRPVLRALQVAGTAAVFSLASELASLFSQPNGASFLFPPAGVSLAAGAAFGVWGVLGVLLGVVASPWGVATTLPGIVLSCLANGLSAAIPAWALRHPVGGTGRRLQRACWFGGFVNNMASAVVGSLGLAALGRLPWNGAELAQSFFFWWGADLAAAVVLGFPLLLWLRPDLLLATPDRTRLREWLRGRRGPAESVILVLAGVVPIAVLEHLGWGFPHWLSIVFLAPIALAALEGGAGPAVLVNGLASTAYLGALVMAGEDVSDLRAVLAPAYTTVGLFSLFALIGGWLAGRNRRLLDRVRAQQAQLERDFERTVASLAAAIEAKDPTTEGHVQRVAQLSVLVGRKMGLDERRLRILRYGAMLHDVGKIGVPEEVLNKPGGLTPEEKEQMEQHVDIGLRIIRDVEALRDVDPLIRYHQERWDGARDGVRYPGYFGLSGEEIPEGARILSVVDAFDAITHDRPYRRGMPVETAVEELRREAGRQFDPRIVEALIEVVREGGWLTATVPVVPAAVPATG